MSQQPTIGVQQRSIIVGEVFASDKPAIVSTVLGSCVAACLHDPLTCIGGMNHFMLPVSHREVASAAFGIHAMEMLINSIMRLGGDRRRLQAKVFGGGNVLALRGSALQVGQRNAAFVRQFLADEGIPLVAHRLGGSCGVKLCFETATARALVKPLPNHALNDMLKREVEYVQHRLANPVSVQNAVTLF